MDKKKLTGSKSKNRFPSPIKSFAYYRHDDTFSAPGNRYIFDQAYSISYT